MGFTPVAVACILFNMFSAVGIVFANKAVFAVYGFPYPVALTWIHIVFTAVGMHIMAVANVFQPKIVPLTSIVDLAVAYVAYIVLGNLSIQLNPVGFYQITKALIAPAILAIQSIRTRSIPSSNVAASVALLSVGIAIATVTDSQVMSNVLGIGIGLAYVGCTAMYNIWAGSKQKQLGAGSSALLQRFSPLAAVLLAFVLPVAEHGLFTRAPSGEEAFVLSVPSATMIFVSAVLGLLVTLSTFLVIGHTSALTYNVVGHIKTVSIIAGGVFMYGEDMSLKKLAGLVVAAGGIAWYSYIKMMETEPAAPLRSPKQRSPRTESPALKSPRSARKALMNGIPSPGAKLSA